MQFTQSCEFISRWTGMTDLHGRWGLQDDDVRLNIVFNARQGVAPGNEDHRRPLHTSTMFRCEVTLPDGETASWVGNDDKGWEINMVHVRTMVKVPGKPPRMMPLQTQL